nr:putative solute-binding protein [Aquirhabdus parva]
MKKIAIAALFTAMSLQAVHAAGDKLTLCVYDPLGARGDAFGYAKDYVLQMPRFGLTNPIDLKAYTNEAIIAEDFKAGQCDGAIMSNLRAREFNKFTGSLDAIGAVPSKQDLNIALQVLSSKQLAPKMSQGDYEVVGMIPLGAAYIMVNDRKINTLAKAAGKKIAVLDYDKSQAKLVQRVGAQPVSVDLTTISGKFNNHQVDIIAGPSVIFKPLELWKGMTDSSGAVKGAVIRFPLIQVTATMVVRKSKFTNEEANQKIREYVFSQIGTAYKYIDNAEKEIDAKYWMDVPDADKIGYSKLMRESRLDLTKDGTYNPDMMKLLKKVRCKTAPTNFECALNDE